MKETHQVEVKEEDPNASKSTTLNLSERPPLVTQPKSETIEIKPKIQPSKFETLLVGAFKKLVGYNEPKNEQNNQNETEINKINACEEELRKALEEVKLFEYMKNDDGISNDEDFMKNIKSLDIDGID